MDIDILARQVRDLTEWKKKHDPMLADLSEAWESHRAEKSEGRKRALARALDAGALALKNGR